MIEELSRLCRLAGVKLIQRGNAHHVQIVGARVVNYYPLSKRRTVYVEGSQTRYDVTPAEAVALAMAGTKSRSEDFKAPRDALNESEASKSSNALDGYTSLRQALSLDEPKKEPPPPKATKEPEQPATRRHAESRQDSLPGVKSPTLATEFYDGDVPPWELPNPFRFLCRADSERYHAKHGVWIPTEG